LAIPAKNIPEMESFYSKLGCKIGRKSSQFVIFKFFGAQVVAHKTDKIEQTPKMYPRHFGIVCDSHEEYASIYAHAIAHDLKIWSGPQLRWPKTEEEHETFFLIDPSNNLIEFKHYKNKSAIFDLDEPDNELELNNALPLDANPQSRRSLRLAHE
jgi:extradiol dioxygenase family protein